jgi:hypothetical protein
MPDLVVVWLEGSMRSVAHPGRPFKWAFGNSVPNARATLGGLFLLESRLVSTCIPRGVLYPFRGSQVARHTGPVDSGGCGIAAHSSPHLHRLDLSSLTPVPAHRSTLGQIWGGMGEDGYNLPHGDTSDQVLCCAGEDHVWVLQTKGCCYISAIFPVPRNWCCFGTS